MDNQIRLKEDLMIELLVFIEAELKAQNDQEWPLFKIIFDSDALMKVASDYGISIVRKITTVLDDNAVEDLSRYQSRSRSSEMVYQEDDRDVSLMDAECGILLGFEDVLAEEREKRNEREDKKIRARKRDMVEVLETRSKQMNCFSCGKNYDWFLSAGRNECCGHLYKPSLRFKNYRCCAAPFREDYLEKLTLPYCTLRDHSLKPTDAKETRKIPLWLIVMAYNHNRHLQVTPHNLVSQASFCHLVEANHMGDVGSSLARWCERDDSSVTGYNIHDDDGEFHINLLESFLISSFISSKNTRFRL